MDFSKRELKVLVKALNYYDPNFRHLIKCIREGQSINHIFIQSSSVKGHGNKFVDTILDRLMRDKLLHQIDDLNRNDNLTDEQTDYLREMKRNLAIFSLKKINKLIMELEILSQNIKALNHS